MRFFSRQKEGLRPSAGFFFLLLGLVTLAVLPCSSSEEVQGEDEQAASKGPPSVYKRVRQALKKGASTRGKTSMEDMFAYLFTEKTDISHFFGEVFEQQWFHVAPDPENVEEVKRFKWILNVGGLKQALVDRGKGRDENDVSMPRDITFVKRKEPTPGDPDPLGVAACATDRLTTPSDIGMEWGSTVCSKKFFNEASKKGYSVVINESEYYLPQIAELTSRLALHWGHKMRTNVYHTPKGAPHSAFCSHWDSTDVIALQLSGRKKWRVRRPLNDLPLQYDMRDCQASNSKNSTLGPIIETFIMEPGHAIYLPRGFVHDASPIIDEKTQTAAEHSLHLTLGLGDFNDELNYGHLIEMALVTMPPISFVENSKATPLLRFRGTNEDSVGNPVPVDWRDILRLSLVRTMAPTACTVEACAVDKKWRPHQVAFRRSVPWTGTRMYTAIHDHRSGPTAPKKSKTRFKQKWKRDTKTGRGRTTGEDCRTLVNLFSRVAEAPLLRQMERVLELGGGSGNEDSMVHFLKDRAVSNVFVALQTANSTLFDASVACEGSNDGGLTWSPCEEIFNVLVSMLPQGMATTCEQAAQKFHDLHQRRITRVVQEAFGEVDRDYGAATP